MTKNNNSKGSKSALLSDVEVMVEVASLYYIEGLKQENIAKRFGLSRSAISHLLSNAKASGIVQINITKPKRVDGLLGKKVAKTFGLKDAILITTPSRSADAVTKGIAEEAISVLNRTVKRNDIVGIGWGSTVHHLVTRFRPDHEHFNVTIVPLMGETDVISQSHQQNELVRLLAQQMNAHAIFIYAPCYPASDADRALYLKTENMRRLGEYWETLDVAVLGIGSPSRLAQTVPQSYLYSQDESQTAAEVSAVGDICVRLVDIAGNVCSSSPSDKVIGVPLHRLKSVPNVVAVAGGEEKAASILGALRTGVIDVLVSDTLTIRRVLQLNEETATTG